MSQPEWVEPHLAAHRLAHHWDISLQIAEQIVRGVLRSNESNDVVRGRGRGLVKGSGFGDTGLRPIGREIGATLNPGSLISWEFSDVEIDWNCLLKHGRNLVLSDIQIVEEYATTLKAAIAELLDNGVQPGKTIAWQTFCDRIRDRTDGWASARDKRPKRGYSDRTIARIVKRQRSKGTRRYKQDVEN